MSNKNALHGIYQGLRVISGFARDIFSKTWELERQTESADVRLHHLKGLEAGMGPLCESIERSGNRYNAVFTDSQLALIVMALRESIQVQDCVLHDQAGKVARAVACEDVIMGLMPDDVVESLSVEQLVDGDEQFLEDMLVEGLMTMDEDTAKGVARIIAETAHPTTLNHDLTSQINNMIHEISEHKAAAIVVSDVEIAIASTTKAKGVVVHQAFGRPKQADMPEQQII